MQAARSDSCPKTDVYENLNNNQRLIIFTRLALTLNYLRVDAETRLFSNSMATRYLEDCSIKELTISQLH